MPEIKFPITVNDITFNEVSLYEKGVHSKCGDLVAVRPCEERFGNKTYLGLYIGEIALSQGVKWQSETGVLEVTRGMHNPMILIPELNEVVFGCGSWWGRIKSKEDLKQITDQDIENVWYVMLMKEKLAELPVSDSGIPSDS